MQKKYGAGYKYLILIVSTLLLAVVYITLSAWGICVGVLKDAFNLSSAQVMAGNGLLLAGYAIGSFVEGRLLGTWGWRKVFLIAMILFVGTMLLIPNVQNYNVILLLRFLQGFGLVVTVTNSIVCGWFPSTKRGLASGILLGAVALGVALGNVLTAAITPALGWKANFYILSIVATIGAIVFMIVVKDPPVLDEDATETEDTVVIKLKPGQSIYKSPIMILLGLAMFCIFFNGYGQYSFLAAFMYDQGYTTSQVATVGMWNGLIGVISTPFGGWIGDVFVKKGVSAIKARAYTMGVVTFVVGTIGCLTMPYLAHINYLFAIIPALLAGWGAAAGNGPICSLPSDVFGPKIGGGAVGFILLVAGAGGVIAPIIVPYIAEATTWTIAWYVTGAAAIIGAIISFATPSLVANNLKKAAAKEKNQSA
ncbi:MAG: MFS transporter [Clostridiales Family XIII bacterium]|jgi:MFS family permease|nr:MFS transporter [Clostridiales Family XIII bacterium]